VYASFSKVPERGQHIFGQKVPERGPHIVSHQKEANIYTYMHIYIYIVFVFYEERGQLIFQKEVNVNAVRKFQKKVNIYFVKRSRKRSTYFRKFHVLSAYFPERGLSIALKSERNRRLGVVSPTLVHPLTGKSISVSVAIALRACVRASEAA
jgi:hypothetical protein